MIAKLKLAVIPWPAIALGCTVFVLGVGLAIRAFGLMASAIWYDESFSLALIQFGPLEMVRLASLDFNPPLWELVAWLPAQIGGLLGLRLTALAFGLLSIWLAWQLAKQLQFSDGQAYAAMALIALLPGLIWTSQDGRCYAMFSALYLGALLFALRGQRLGLVACCGLLVYTNNAGPIYASSALVVYAAAGYGWRNANTALWWISALSVTWIQTFIPAIGADFNLGPLSLWGLAQSIYSAFFIGSPAGQLHFYIFVLLLVACVLSALILAWNTDRPLLIAAGLPLGLMVGFSIFQRNMIFYRPLIPLVIPAALLFARALTPHRLTRSSWVMPWTWTWLVMVALVAWSPSIRGGQLDQAAARIRADWRPGDVIYYANASAALPGSYYLADLPGYVLDEPQPSALLQRPLAAAFGLQYAELGQIDHQRAWIIWPRDPIMTGFSQKRMGMYTQGAELVTSLVYPQLSKTEIYLEGK